MGKDYEGDTSPMVFPNLNDQFQTDDGCKVHTK